MEIDNDEDEPVMCSKCNKPFQNESEYLQHYNEKHKPENNWEVCYTGPVLMHCL